MTCRELVERVVTDGIEALGAEDRRHLGECRHCTDYTEAIDATVRTLRELPAEPADPHVRERLLATFRELQA